MANKIKRKEGQIYKMRLNESKQLEKPWKVSKENYYSQQFVQCYKNKISNTFESMDEKDRVLELISSIQQLLATCGN